MSLTLEPQTLSESLVVPLDCAVHVVPRSLVCRIVPLVPTTKAEPPPALHTSNRLLVVPLVCAVKGGVAMSGVGACAMSSLPPPPPPPDPPAPPPPDPPDPPAPASTAPSLPPSDTKLLAPSGMGMLRVMLRHAC